MDAIESDREFREGVSPHTTQREYAMAQNDAPLPGTYMAIEVYGPDGMQWIECDTIPDLRAETKRAAKFGYELTAAKAGGIGAFVPRVEPDEVGEFDLPPLNEGES